MANEKPLITALMLTGGHPGRRIWANHALEAFSRQTYVPRELIIVNQSLGTDYCYSVLQPGSTLAMEGNRPRVSLSIPSHPPICRHELFVRRGDLTIGDLRNIGLREAHGKWILPWDDDDWHHPRRMASMWDHGDGDHAVIIRRHVRYDCSRNTAWVYHDLMGCGGIMLYPRRAGLVYPSLDREEDTCLYLNHFRDAIHWDNHDFPHIYLRFFHGGNLGSRQHIMKQFGNSRFDGKWLRQAESPWGLPKDSAAYLHKILREHYGIVSPGHVNRRPKCVINK